MNPTSSHREVEVAARISHPNVVAAVDADEDRGVHCLAMEYIPGRALDRIAKAGGPARALEKKDVTDWYRKVAIRHILREAESEISATKKP